MKNDERMAGPVDLFRCKRTRQGSELDISSYLGTYTSASEARAEANKAPGLYATVDGHGHRSFFSVP